MVALDFSVAVICNLTSITGGEIVEGEDLPKLREHTVNRAIYWKELAGIKQRVPLGQAGIWRLAAAQQCGSGAEELAWAEGQAANWSLLMQAGWSRTQLPPE